MACVVDMQCMNTRSDQFTSATARSLMRRVWSTPHNWCDRRCERCPVASDCDVHRSEITRRAEYEARGENPNNPTAVAEDVLQSLQSAVGMLEQMAREAGIDIDEQLPQPPVSLNTARVQRAGKEVLRALTQLRVPVDLASEVLAHAAYETVELGRSWSRKLRASPHTPWTSILTPGHRTPSRISY